jgi:hypothetical protein
MNTRIFLGVILLCGSYGICLADGDAPTRRMNSSESAAFSMLQSTIRDALPQSPANYLVTYTGFDNMEVPETISPEQMNRMSFKAQYTLDPKISEARQQAALMDLINGTPEQQAKRAAIAAREKELKQARKSTRDPAEKEKIRTELKKINEEDNALTDEIVANSQKSLSAGAGMQSNDPKEFSVRILVNQDVHVYDIAKPYLMQGVPLAFEQNDKCQDSRTYCITVLLGNFDKEKRISGSTRFNLHNASIGVPTKARGMALIVSGPTDKTKSTQDFLKKINVAKLKALLP